MNNLLRMKSCNLLEIAPSPQQNISVGFMFFPFLGCSFVFQVKSNTSLGKSISVPIKICALDSNSQISFQVKKKQT